MKKSIQKIIDIPDNVTFNVDLPKITANGPLGASTKLFKLKNIEFKMENKKIIIGYKKSTKREKKLINTIASHIASMIIGVTRGFEYKLQICSIHFPITVKVDKQNNIFSIKNFLGENKERNAKIIPNVDINIDGDIITVKGMDKESVGQQAANLETATKIRKLDRRIFQDGIWIISKEKGRRYK